jgi:hypothetical protein
MANNNDEQGIIPMVINKKRTGFVKFGLLGFNRKSLEANRIRAVYWKQLASCGRVQNVSTKCIDTLEDMIYNKEKFNMFNFFDLSKKEQDIILKYLKTSKMDEAIGFNYIHYLTQRLKVLQAEMNNVDNDNPELRKECIDVVKQLHKYGKIKLSVMNESIESLKD